VRTLPCARGEPFAVGGAFFPFGERVAAYFEHFCHLAATVPVRDPGQRAFFELCFVGHAGNIPQYGAVVKRFNYNPLSEQKIP